jgi:cytochrome b involved in lipid metabolism
VGHSKKAGRMLAQYCIGQLAGDAALAGEEEAAATAAAGSRPGSVKKETVSAAAAIAATATDDAPDVPAPYSSSSSSQLRLISAEEVAQHNRASDCWIILGTDSPEGAFVYDVTDYIDDHPGGPEIVTKYAGEDATLMFDMTGHSDEAIEMLKDFVIGKLAA